MTHREAAARDGHGRILASWTGQAQLVAAGRDLTECGGGSVPYATHASTTSLRCASLRPAKRLLDAVAWAIISLACAVFSCTTFW